MKQIVGLSIAVALVIDLAYATTFELGKIDVLDSSNLGDKKFDNAVVFDEEIQNHEKKTIAEALDTISGVNIYNSGARNEQMITVRGFDVKHVPLFIDGIPIAVAYDGYVDFSRFTTFDLSQIEMSKGLTSVLLGANAFAGAINLVTKKPTKEFEGILSAGVFTGEGKKGYLNIGTNQENYYIQLSTSYLSRDNFPLSDDFVPTALEDGDAREQSGTQDKKINIKVGFTPNATDEYAINYIKQSADKGVPPTTDAVDFPRYWDWNYWDKESIYFLSKTNFDGFYLKSRLFYDKFKNSLSIYTDNSYSTYSFGGIGNPSWYDDNTKGISVELGQLNSTNNKLKVALHAKKDTHTEGGENQAALYEMSVNTYSLGIEDSYQINDKTKITLGASYDKDEVQRADNTNFGSKGNYGSIPDGTDITGYGLLKEFAYGKADAFNPMAKIEYSFDESLKLYGGVAKKTRFPSIKDRYSFKFKRFIPNSNLKEESTINYEIGFRKDFENSTLKGSIFYANIKDFIQSTYVDVYFGTTQQQQLQNIGSVRQKGFEIEYLHAFENGLTLNANYTKLLLEDKDGLVEITNVPQDKLTMALSYKPLANLMTTIDMKYSSSQKTSATAPYRETGNMTLWNTKMIYDVSKQTSIDVGVHNIFDKNYQLDYGFPESGRVIFANVTYKF